MYVDSSNSGKYSRHLIRESFREDGKVKHRTIANISDCSVQEINAIKLALKHKNELTDIINNLGSPSIKQGKSIGAVWLVYDMAKKLGIINALGSTREGKLALWQVISRVIDQGSRLSAVRLAGSHAACEVLRINEPFNEDHLYSNLDWLHENQKTIEDRLFKFRNIAPEDNNFFLYDVTSSYLEGTQNELGAFGYNRDKKKGKKQIVVGLLCDAHGRPLSIEVFTGNTQDPATFSSQIKKVTTRFGGGTVTLVGDRGMIKSKQITDILGNGLHYITAITKPQMESLLKENIIQMSLFDQKIAEVQTDEGIRYVLRNNPVRAEDMRQSRESKMTSLKKKINISNLYLSEHPKAKVETALKHATEYCKKLKLSRWIEVTANTENRKLEINIDNDVLDKEAQLDGCYVLKTDLISDRISKEDINMRYKNLANVEWAFRSSKTVNLELRPINVRLASRTRGHAFIVMLAYLIIQELRYLWRDIEITVEEGIKELCSLCLNDVKLNASLSTGIIPVPRKSVKKLLDIANVKLPTALPTVTFNVSTRKKLTKRRKPL
jgi:transposase